MIPMRYFFVITVGVLMVYFIVQPSQSSPSKLSPTDYANGTKRAAEAAQRIIPRLKSELATKKLKLGSPVFIRIFKQSKQLELWIESEESKHFTLFKTYPIAAMSGTLGPKLTEGDRQAPEGFYFVRKGSMHPTSRFHLAFNIGYPNAYDKAHARTGSAIMVHGDRVSIGCFSMTDPWIEEIYTLCNAALQQGQPFFRMHIFPFPLTHTNLAAHQDSRWHAFWQTLQKGFLYFQTHQRPPNTVVKNGNYEFKKE